MKVVLSRDGIKREIETPFAMCIGTKELGELIRSLQGAEAAAKASNTSFGWFMVDTNHPDKDSKNNSPPKKWIDP